MSNNRLKIYCVACDKNVEAISVFGDSIYPHRPDLAQLLFYQCPICRNYVGSHKDGRPLGSIPTIELRKARHQVHLVIDEYWLPTKDQMKRKKLYTDLSKFIGKEYHTGNLNSVEECKKIVNYYLEKYGYDDRDISSNRRSS